MTTNRIDDSQAFAAEDAASYFVRANETAITTLRSGDSDVGATFAIVGGPDAALFNLDPVTGELSFTGEQPTTPGKTFLIFCTGPNGTSRSQAQAISVHVTADKMTGDAAQAAADTFVFHPKFGVNTVVNFDLDQDFLQFDLGMFAEDSLAAVLDSAQDRNGNLEIDVYAGHLTILGVTKADLLAHADAIIFV